MSEWKLKLKRNWLAPTVFAALVLLSSGCGNNTSTSTASAITSCATGYVYSSTYGCLLQSSCSSGYALYNGSCVPVTTTTVGTTTTTTGACQGTCGVGYVRTNYGCLPQNTCMSCYGYASGWCFPGY